MRERLRQEQYRDDSNLNARADLHRRFSANPVGMHRWVFDQLVLPARACLLEVGCGPGMLWAENRERVPAGGRVVLSDFSPGMVVVARQRLGGGQFEFEVADAEALPHPDRAFDAVIANHMLYHVPDRRRAIAELARVVRPGGVVCTTTNGRRHMSELDPWTPGVESHAEAFGLENGAVQLRQAFAEVELRRYADHLEVTDPEAVLDYVRSMTMAGEADRAGLRAAVVTAIQREGAFRIGKDVGLFLAQAPLRPPGPTQPGT
jgi:SAM-dependent methyltransferase